MEIPTYISQYCKQLIALRPKCVGRLEVDVNTTTSIALGDLNEINIFFTNGNLISLHSVTDRTSGKEVGKPETPHWPEIAASLMTLKGRISETIRDAKLDLDKIQAQLNNLKIEEPRKPSNVGRAVQYWEKTKDNSALCQPSAALVIYQDYYGDCRLRLFASRYGAQHDIDKDGVREWKGHLDDWRECPFDCFWKAAQ